MVTPMFVKVIGVLLVLMAILFQIVPELMKKTYRFFIKGVRIYIAGVIRLFLGIMFLLAASQCKIPAVIIALGVLLIVAGVMIFAIKLDKIKAIINSVQQKPVIVLRFLLLVPLAIGLIIVYCA